MSGNLKTSAQQTVYDSNTRAYSYSKQSYANQPNGGMPMQFYSLPSPLSLAGLFNEIVNFGITTVSDSTITLGVVGVALGGYYIYRYLLKNKKY
jgi:hypothetical protein